MVSRADSQVLVVTPVDLKAKVWVDYNGPLHPASGVLVFDTFSDLWNAVRVIPDSVVVTDSLNLFMQDMRLADTVTMSDAGTVVRYDYAEIDYFATPVDYVGDRRDF